MAACISACSGGTAAPPTTVQPSLQLELLLTEAYEIATLVTRAEDLLVAGCMRRQGFEYPEVITRSTGEVLHLTYDLDTWDPSGDGYWFSTTSGDPVPTEVARAREYLAALSPEEQAAYQRALFGDGEFLEVRVGELAVSSPASGCLAEASAAIVEGDQAEGARLSALVSYVSSLSLDVGIQVDADPAMVETTRAWSECMAANGYEFADPSVAASAALAARPERTTGPDQAERAQATADRDCQIASGFVDIERDLYRRYEADRLAEPEAQALLVEWSAMSGQAQARAAELLRQATQPVPQDND